MAIPAAACSIRLGKTLTPDFSLPTLSEAFFGRLHDVPDLSLEPVPKDDRDALFTLFIQTVSQWDKDVGGFVASIGAVESDSTEENVRKAFLFALNLNNVKLGPPKEVSVDHALHAMKIHAENLKYDRLTLWEVLAGEHPATRGKIAALRNASGIDVARQFLEWMKTHEHQLKNIKNLRLAPIRLTALPPEIGFLTQLRDLDLAGSFGDLIHLEELYLSNCRLQSLPEDIGKLQNLRILRLPKLEKLPQSIEFLHKLETLQFESDILLVPSSKLPANCKVNVPLIAKPRSI